MESKINKLVKFNLFMGIIQLIQGLIMLALATSVIQKVSEFQPMVKQYFYSFNTQTQFSNIPYNDLFTLPFGILIASYLFISSVSHFIIFFNKKKYEEGLLKKINKYRWLEYALSSSIMIVLIASLAGITDISVLAPIFVANAAMNLLGLDMEYVNPSFEKDKINWRPFIWGAIAVVLPWIAIFAHLIGRGDFTDLPWYVWTITFAYFFAFITFPINMILSFKQVGKWKDYLHTEKSYMILSLFAKTLISWLVLFVASIA